MKRYTLKLGVALAAVAAAGTGVTGPGAAWAQTSNDAHGGTATDLSFQLAMAEYKGDEAAAPAVRDAPVLPALAPPAALDVSAGAVSALAPVIADGSLGTAPRKGVKPVKPAPLGPPATATTPGPDGLLLGGAYIESDNMRELKDKTVIAYGHVQMRYKEKTIFADQVSYDPNTQITIATGHTVTVDEDGSMQFADSATYDSNMNQGTSGNFADLGADNTKIFARRVDRIDENTNRLYNIIYTPCQLCASHGVTQPPTWSISATKVTERKDKEMIYYDNAVIKLKGVPVFYSPLLWTPDPGMPRASGLLQPIPGNNRARGISLQQPYLWVISPYSYLIIDPEFNSKVNPLLNLQYERRFYSGDLNIRFGVTDDKFFDNAGHRWGTDATRGYVIADGRFKINDDWRWSFTAEHVDDPNKDINPATGKPYGDNANFFERYGVNGAWDQRGEWTVDARELINQANLTRQTPNSFVSLSMADFQSLQIAGYENLTSVTTRPYIVSSDTFPTIAPMVEAYWSPDFNILGGEFTAGLNALGLQHKVFPGVKVAPAAADGTTGFDTARVTATASWTADYIFGTSGFKGGPFFDLRHDYYHETDLTSAGLSADASRDLATAGFNLSYPLFRKFKDIAVVVEPVAQVAVSPKYQSNPDIPTEDSQSLELDETDLFTPNRSPGFDLYEGGARLNMGVRTSWLWDKGMKINTLVGRVYRDDVQTQFLQTATDPRNSVTATDAAGKTVDYDPYGLAYKESDWIADGDFDTGKGLYGYSRIRLDSSTLRLRQGEAGLSVYSPRTEATMRYIVNNTYPVVDPATHRLTSTFGPNYRDLQLYARHFLTSHWGVSARLDRDLLLDKWRRSTLSLIYKDDCIWVEVIYERNDTILNAVNGKPQQGFLLQIKPLILGVSGSTEMHDVR
jgi:LPS-assembly protein